MPSPHTILAAVVLWGGSVAGAGWWAYGQGRDHEVAAQAREDAASAKAAQVAADAAAKAISKIKVSNTTIQAEVRRELETRTVYADCRHDARGMLLINQALTGAAGGGELPASDAAH